ncbi:MAG TPA: hypothetical protein VGC77_12240 [Rhodopseudomonas sp.]
MDAAALKTKINELRAREEALIAQQNAATNDKERFELELCVACTR